MNAGRNGGPYEGLPRLSDIDTNPQPLPPHIYFAELESAFISAIEDALLASGAGKRDARAIRYAVGLRRSRRPHGAPLCHLPTRRIAGDRLFQTLHPIWSSSPDRTWFFGTVFTDLGNSLEYEPHIELGRLKRDVRKMLVLANMHAVGLIEFQRGRYPLSGRGRTIQAHAHTLGYVEGRDVSPGGLEKLIAARSTLSNWLGAPVAKFKPIPNRANLEFWCQYMFKAPIEESYLRSDSRVRSGFRTESHGRVERWGALRLAQILARLSLRDATFACGDLVRTKGDWIRQVVAWTARRPLRTEPDYLTAFNRVWAASNVVHERAEPIIRTDDRAPLSLAWAEAMQLKFLKVAQNQARYDAEQAMRQQLRRNM